MKQKKTKTRNGDTDTCENIQSYFQLSPVMISEKAISLDDQYILNISGTKSTIAALSSNNDCELLSIENGLTSCGKISNDCNVQEVKFCPNNENLLYIACQNGNIQLYDIRTNALINEYKEEITTDKRKPISSFDVAPNGKILCVGSELFQSNAFIIFYDHRISKPLGGYWDSHTDEVTQVKFHPDKSFKLVSGSSDGLINIYDISEQNESDALQFSLNTESLIEKISWSSEEVISCILQDHKLQMWDVETADKLNEFDRETITENIMRTSSDDCYLVHTYNDKNGRVTLLCGSQYGKGNVLRSLNIIDSKMQPNANFSNNKQVVRCCWNNKDENLLVTGGESGIVNIWKLSEGNEEIVVNKLSTKTIVKNKHKSNPYTRH